MREQKFTELHSAAFNCDPEWVNKRIAAGDDVNAHDTDGYAPLHWCALRAKVGVGADLIAAALIDHGADPNVRAKGGLHYSPLHCAVDSGSLSVIRVLIDHGADVNAEAKGVTPLMRAAAEGDIEIVSLLISSGADIRRKIGNFTAFSYADYYGHEHLYKILAD